MHLASLGRSIYPLATACLVAAVVFGGCQRDNRSVGLAGRGGAANSAKRSQTLLDSVAGELADLPEQSILELRPPSIILDSTKSSDGQDVEAELTTLSSDVFPIYNILRVPKGNARFKSLNVRPGDLIRWYADQQSELESEFGGGRKRLSPEQVREIMKLPENERQEVADAMLREMQVEGDIVSTTAFEFKVEQVLDTNTLRVDLSSLSDEERGRLPIDLPMRLEILRYRDSRFSDLIFDKNRYARRGVPLLGWEPSPDRAATEQIVERLNQWLRQTKSTVDWQATELRSTLPQSLRDADDMKLFLSDKALDRAAFSLPSKELRSKQAQGYEGRLLQEATWARDLSNWVAADELENRGRVDRLFDWTVRNLQLDPPSGDLPPYRPWQAVLHGHATAQGRAWVFAQLCRQQDVPVVVLRPAGDDVPFWCGAIMEGEVYLYDPDLGLPLLNADGDTATLAEIRNAPSLLDPLDTAEVPYFGESANLDDLTAELVAGPFSLTRRAALLEARLSGDDALRLYVDADGLAADLEKLEGLGSVRLWDYPYQVIRQQLGLSQNLRTRAAIEFEPFVHKPRLWKARLLHFRGTSGTSVDTNRGNLETAVDDHREAGRLYTDENVRPTGRTIEQLEAADVRRTWTKAKQNATYWQGLLSYDRGDYQVSLDWLEKAAAFDQWQDGALYNRARA